jgi:hypothetical protein
VTQGRAYTRDEVVVGGFEAECVDPSGCRYLWHRGQGICHDPSTCSTTLLMNPSALPDGPWHATLLGESELSRGGLG